MSKVTPEPVAVHDLLAGAPFQDQLAFGPGLTLLAVLVAVALVLFSAMRALVGAVALLLAPLFALARSFVLVVGLIVVLGLGLARGPAEPENVDPGPPEPTATSVRERPTPAKTKPAPRHPPPVRSSLSATGR